MRRHGRLIVVRNGHSPVDRRLGEAPLAPRLTGLSARKSRSNAAVGEEREAMPKLPFQTLYFEDLAVGMRETLHKTVENEDVIGFAELSGRSQSDPSLRAFRPQDALRRTDRPRALHREPHFGGHRHAAAGAGRRLHLADPQFSRAGEDRRRRRRQRRSRRTDGKGAPGAAAVRMPGRTTRSCSTARAC